MKKYREYMDSVRASDTLHQRLLGLEASGKRPIPWKRYGTMAAALVLVCGLGGFAAWGLGREEVYEPLVDYDPIAPEIADEPVPDIALVEPGDVTEPGMKTIGGYEVISGSGENAIAAYYILPYIEYGDVRGTRVCIDWDIPQGATRRDLTWDETITLMGGLDAVNTHLDWGMYALTGWAAWYEDGSFWGAYINGLLPNYDGPTSRFEFAVTAGHLPPTCFGYPESVTQEIRGLEITADGYDSVATPSGGEDASCRRVSFMKDGYGYRFDITGSSRAQTEERVSRLVCHIADRGLGLYLVDGTADVCYPEDGTYVCADCGQTVPAGTKHSHPHIGADATYTCDICGHDIPVGSTHNHPFMGADGVCPDCGAAIPAGTEHICQISDGHPLASTCEICGEIYTAGTEHHCAGGTHTCDICGEVLPIDVEHSHHAPDPAESWEISDGHPLAPEGWNGPSGSSNCEVCGQPLQEGVEHSHHDDGHSGHH